MPARLITLLLGLLSWTSLGCQAGQNQVEEPAASASLASTQTAGAPSSALSDTLPPPTSGDVPSPDSIIHSFSFETPDERWTLPNSLDEISGLALLDADHVAAVQDERGKLYVLSLTTGQVVADYRFGKNGDFEDVERVGDVIYALRSDGTLYEIKGWENEDPDTRKIETALSSRHDTEGLTYDPTHHRLLILCKEYAGKNMKGQRAIFSFDLATERLSEDPVFVIDLDTELNEHPMDRVIRKWTAPIIDTSDFKPAALARDPITGHYLAVSSVRKIMVELGPEGQLLSVRELPESLFRQPEGLVFLPNGDLLVANEARGEEATLLRFNRH